MVDAGGLGQDQVGAVGRGEGDAGDGVGLPDPGPLAPLAVGIWKPKVPPPGAGASTEEVTVSEPILSGAALTSSCPETLASGGKP